MKKKILTLTTMIACIAMVALFCGPAQAAVTGVCSECHTMHDSQGGVAMATGGPNSALLMDGCLGCHTTTLTDPLNGNGYPYVKLGSATDDNCLAGGFFQTDANIDDNNANQNHDIGATAVPAGFDATETSWYTGDTDNGGNGLGCAGSNGCHGNQTDLNDMTAISGGHHNPSAYRILYVGANGVVGSGAKDYEELIIKTPATTPDTSGAGQNVNIYSAGADDPSISELCAKCHGDFHGVVGDVGESGAWIRHPTDVVIPPSWAIGTSSHALDGDDYKNNPVGYDGAVISDTGRRATCLSCHRAHGTANADLLRWAYSTQSAGNSAEFGCLGCHNKQR